MCNKELGQSLQSTTTITSHVDMTELDDTHCAICSMGMKKRQDAVSHWNCNSQHNDTWHACSFFRPSVTFLLKCTKQTYLPCSQSNPSCRPSPLIALLALRNKRRCREVNLFVAHIHFLMTFQGARMTKPVYLLIHPPSVCLMSKQGEKQQLCRYFKITLAVLPNNV